MQEKPYFKKCLEKANRLLLDSTSISGFPFSAYDFIYETEANFFAAQLLMPEQILIELTRRGKELNKEFLKETFNVSEEAAEKRLITLKKILNWESKKSTNPNTLDNLILKKFSNFIDEIQ